VVSADQPEEARGVRERLAAERNSPLTLIGRDYWYRQVGQDLVHQTFRAGRTGEPGSLYLLPLVGLHQAHNATVALAALELVRQGGRLPALTDEAIRQGMAGVRWQARFQLLNRRPVVIVDGAHNVAAVARLRETLESLFSGRRIILIFGVTADKDVPHMLETLAPVATEIIVTEANHPRAALPSDLTQMLAAMGRFAHSAPTVLQALEQSWAMSGPDDVICITGSLFVAGDALFAWEQFAEPTGALRAAPVEELTEVR
jgi:dihydrofolate synthase/folylpolyglutamate synthase